MINEESTFIESTCLQDGCNSLGLVIAVLGAKPWPSPKRVPYTWLANSVLRGG